MVDLIQKISDVTDSIDGVVDDVRGNVAKLLGIEDPVRLLPYRGYGSAKSVLVKGRVLKDEGIRLKEENPPIYENVLNMFRRFATDEVPNARIKVRLGAVEKEVLTDEEGFFNVELAPAEAGQAIQFWQPIDLALIEPCHSPESPLETAEVMVVGETAQFGVISDIDDTIVHTAATDLLKMIRIVYMGNADSRRPFAGVPEFYQALQAGGGGAEHNPIFYVSSSAWNMYDVFERFMDLNSIPKGPVLLKDIELSLKEIISFKHETHKIEQIQPIFERYADLPFILIGDSGQKDPEIYHKLVQDYPGRIAGVLIRDVVPNNQARTHEIHRIADLVRAAGVKFLLFQDTEQAIALAQKQGWITQSDIALQC